MEQEPSKFMWLARKRAHRVMMAYPLLPQVWNELMRLMERFFKP